MIHLSFLLHAYFHLDYYSYLYYISVLGVGLGEHTLEGSRQIGFLTNDLKKIANCFGIY